MALVYHDIGLWTDSDLAYLEPSCAAAEAEAKKLGLSESDQSLLRDIIFWHHKVRDFSCTGDAQMRDSGWSSAMCNSTFCYA
jgi:hypothetical protein